MKIKKIIDAVVPAAFVLSGVLIVCYKWVKWNAARCGVRPGDVWVFETGYNRDKDPFHGKDYITNTVLAVSNGYVKYNGPYWSVRNHDWSKTCEDFRSGSFLLHRAAPPQPVPAAAAVATNAVTTLEAGK